MVASRSPGGWRRSSGLMISYGKSSVGTAFPEQDGASGVLPERVSAPPCGPSLGGSGNAVLKWVRSGFLPSGSFSQFPPLLLLVLYYLFFTTCKRVSPFMRKNWEEVSPFMRREVSPFMRGKLGSPVDIVNSEENAGPKPIPISQADAAGLGSWVSRERGPKHLGQARSSSRATPAQSSSTPGDTSFGSPGR